MKPALFFLALISLPAFAETHIVHLEHETKAVRKLKDLQPGDEIGFPYKFELNRSRERPEYLSHWIKFDGGEEHPPICVFETPAGDRDDYQVGPRLYWKVKQRPQEFHELFRKGRTMLVLKDPNTGREIAMTCDEGISLDALGEADFDIPDTTERRPRFHRMSATPEDAPAAESGSSAI